MSYHKPIYNLYAFSLGLKALLVFLVPPSILKLNFADVALVGTGS